jgi:hypothetical protein
MMRKDISDSFELKLKPDQKEKFDSNLQDSYTGTVYDILAKLLKLIVQTNIIIPAIFKR